VLQRPIAFPGTVADNLRVAAPDATDDDVTRHLEHVGLDRGFADRLADELSGGEAQRMCIARALAVEPEVLLADEPTSSLDTVATGRVEGLLHDLADEGIPIIVATHDAGQVERLGAVTVRVEDGTVVMT